MKVEQLRKMFKNKSKLITMRINPELLNLLDATVKKDKEFDSRNELIETLILRYLEQREVLK
jgi:metal-responsive CopG/Arc/MetJ family transcriptional regulator